MITLNSCPICDSRCTVRQMIVETWPHIRHEIMPGVEVDAALLTYFFTCQNCHVVFQNPRLSDEELNRFYSEGFYRRMLDTTDEKIDQDESYRAKIDSEIIKQHVGNINSHLDIGCSRGYLLEAVGADTKVGVESNISYVTASDVKVYSEINQVAHKSFDLLTAIHILEHVSDPVGFLKKWLD